MKCVFIQRDERLFGFEGSIGETLRRDQQSDSKASQCLQILWWMNFNEWKSHRVFINANGSLLPRAVGWLLTHFFIMQVFFLIAEVTSTRTSIHQPDRWELLISVHSLNFTIFLQVTKETWKWTQKQTSEEFSLMTQRHSASWLKLKERQKTKCVSLFFIYIFYILYDTNESCLDTGLYTI